MPRGIKAPGGRYDPFVEPALEWRASTVQACGLYPFAVGGQSPMVGVPLGRNLLTGAAVCCDPLSWFRPTRILATPSAFVLGLPALGKSTLVRRQLIGLAARGVTAICAGDLKPDYADVVRALGGQVIQMGTVLLARIVLKEGLQPTVARETSGQPTVAGGGWRQADRMG